jgi:hypothetical protein
MVVVSYVTPDGTWRLLDPETGEYSTQSRIQPVTVSPNLCHVADTDGGLLQVAPAIGGDPVVLEWPTSTTTLAWSPDGNKIAGPRPAPRERSLPPLSADDQLRYWQPSLKGTDVEWTDAQMFRELVIVNLVDHTVSRITLDLPQDRIAASGGRIAWLTDEHLAVATAPFDPARARARLAAGLRAEPASTGAITVFDAGGDLVRELPVNFGDDLPDSSYSGLGWELAGLVNGDSALMLRWRDARTVELTAMTLATTKARPAPPAMLTFPEPPDGYAWFGDALAWHGEAVIFQVSLHPVAPPTVLGGPPESAPQRATILSRVDLESRDVRRLLPANLPAGVQLGALGDAIWLSPAASTHAATMGPFR